MLGREASLSVPPPVAAPQPMRCEAALSPPSMAHAVPTRAAPAPRRPGRQPQHSPCPPSPGLPRPAAPRLTYRPLPRCRFRCSRRRKSSAGPRKWSPCCRGRGSGRRRWSARRRRTSRASLRSSSRKRKHRRASPLLQRQRRHFVRWWGQFRWASRDAKGPVQPVAATSQGQHRLVLRHAPRRCRRTSRHDRLRGLNAALPHAASQRRGPGRVQPVVAQSLAGIGAPVVAVGQEGRPREFSGRPREGDTLVALVSGLERSRRVQCAASVLR